MPRQARKIVEKTYYYDSLSSSESESDSDFVLDDFKSAELRCPVMQARRFLAADSESESESESEPISDSEDGTDYETESDPDSDSESLDDPRPYYGKGFRVYFDSSADKKFFMRAFGFK
jgi:hypothetical protein